MTVRRTLVLTGAITACALVFAAAYYAAVPENNPAPAVVGTSEVQPHIVHIAGETLYVDVAQTPAERQQGLSGRDLLLPGTGMLFVFPEEGKYPFWMKDMRFPIDIIWLGGNGRVVGFWKDATPSSYPRHYAPEAPAQYVLEVPAGFVRAHGVAVGETAVF